jgi:hypothetical protein|tara:strand:+ start:1667 stop:1906 length:240 start_codon:yes stop_codon:yes gene_type:complete
MELINNIQQREKDIENWDLIKKFLIIYLAEVAIPDFTRKKVLKYIDAMAMFSFDEMKNAEKHLSCWGEFGDLAKSYSKV